MDLVCNGYSTALNTLTLEANSFSEKHNNGRPTNPHASNQKDASGGCTFLFRKRDGSSWVTFYRDPFGEVKGLFSGESSKRHGSLSVKGLPSYLKIEHIDQAQWVLQSSQVRLTQYFIEVIPRLKGGMIQPESKESTTDIVDHKGHTAFDLADRLNPVRSTLIRKSRNQEDESTVNIPIKYLDDREAPEFSVLGSGAYNTVYKVAYWQNGQKRTGVYKREALLVEGDTGIPKLLGINPNDPKTAFRNCLYAEMAEALGLEIVSPTRLGIYKRELYTVMTLAEGCMAAGREIKVRIVAGCELAQDLNYFYRQWKKEGKGFDWQSYIKPFGISNLLNTYGMTGVEEPFIEKKEPVWYGSALRAPEVPINFEDPNLRAALCAMQLLDLLLFQLDRNLSNFFIKTDGEGNFERLTTIDNDFCISKYYLDPKTLEPTDSELAKALCFPVWVPPEVAQKFLELEEPTLAAVFNVFGNVFGKAELEASQQMLRSIQAHLRQITLEGKTAKDFLEDPDGLLVGLKQHTQRIISKQVFEGTTWENVDTLLNGLPEDINAKDAQGRTALHRAAAQGEESIVRLLLYRNAHLEAKDRYNHTPLHLAAQNGHSAIVELFLGSKYKVYLSVKNYRNQTAVHLAALHGHKKVVQQLVAFDKILLSERDIKGKLPLHLAIEGGHIELVQWLLNFGMEHMSLATYLKVKETQGATPLHLSVVCPKPQLTDLLLKSGADIWAQDNKKRTPLHLAAEQGRTDSIGLLLKKTNIITHSQYLEVRDHTGATALQLAAGFQQLDTINMLLNSGANLSQKDNLGKTILHTAAEIDAIEIIWLCLSKNVPLSTQDLEGNTALHLAVGKGHVRAIDALLNRKHASTLLLTLTKNNTGCTVLHIAAQHGHTEALKMLMAQNAAVDAKDNSGNQPLHLAACGGYLESMQLLIAQGAPIKARNALKNTPLQSAVNGGHLQAVTLLVEKGALQAETLEAHYQAVALAIENDHFSVASFLKDELIKIKLDFVDQALRLASSKNHAKVAQFLSEKAS